MRRVNPKSPHIGTGEGAVRAWRSSSSLNSRGARARRTLLWGIVPIMGKRILQTAIKLHLQPVPHVYVRHSLEALISNGKSLLRKRTPFGLANEVTASDVEDHGCSSVNNFVNCFLARCSAI
ncbi:hypothetical protein EVAR_33448_1 [Eumeta japonica]|uniref:Uncharacterized protein n=1 Tax=Eumeta variegata TaxID=151549 RepID=A0A4C1W3E1_EUMVA|nr:hypothetical protein EVAR_33448_1 [Eumeta japonica]